MKYLQFLFPCYPSTVELFLNWATVCNGRKSQLFIFKGNHYFRVMKGNFLNNDSTFQYATQKKSAMGIDLEKRREMHIRRNRKGILDLSWNLSRNHSSLKTFLFSFKTNTVSNWKLQTFVDSPGKILLFILCHLIVAWLILVKKIFLSMQIQAYQTAISMNGGHQQNWL